MTAGARLLPSDADNDLPFQLPPELPRSGPVDVPAMAAESHWPAEAFGALVLVSPAQQRFSRRSGAASLQLSAFERLVLRHSSLPMLVLWNVRPAAPHAQQSVQSVPDCSLCGKEGCPLCHAASSAYLMCCGMQVWLFWFFVAICTHFRTLVIPAVVCSAMGICTIVGATLNTNAYAMWAETRGKGDDTSLRAFARDGPFSCARFFMIPFCVASYSGIINQEAALGNFWFLFPVRGRDGTQLVQGVPDVFVLITTLAAASGCMLLLRKRAQDARSSMCTEGPETAAQESVDNPLATK